MHLPDSATAPAPPEESQCAGEARLWASYQDALTIMRLCEAPSLVAVPGEAAAAAAARAALIQARHSYREHIRRHRCRQDK